MLGGSSTRSLASMLAVASRSRALTVSVGRASDFGLPLSPAAFLHCSSCRRSSKSVRPLRLSSLQTGDRFHKQEEEKERGRERERKNITAGDPSVYKCYTWNLGFVGEKKKRHTHMQINAPGHVTSPLSKVNWMNKEMDRADKENKKQPNGRECRINSVGRWVLVSICAILIRWIETIASAEPKTSHLWPPWQT